MRGWLFAGFNKPAGFDCGDFATFPAPNDASCISKLLGGVGRPLCSSCESREFTWGKGLFIAPNTGKFSLKLKLNPRPRAARGHTDHLLGEVVARPRLQGGVPLVLIIRGFFAVETRTTTTTTTTTTTSTRSNKKQERRPLRFVVAFIPLGSGR